MPKGPFVKLYRSLFDGTLGQERSARDVFVVMLTHADADGVVEMTPEAISARSGIPVEEVRAGIAILEAADPDSRSPAEEGKRIVRLDAHRTWGWRIVNYPAYRTRSGADRERDRRQRLGNEYRQRDRERKRAIRARRKGGA